MADYLIHHGIKGQKWGLRRFQNEDMSLTPAGRERYGVGTSTLVSTKPSWQAKGTINEYSAPKMPKGAVSLNSNKQNGEKKPLDKEKVKKALKVGAVVAGTALAAYGAYKIVDMKKNAATKTGSDFMTSLYKQSYGGKDISSFNNRLDARNKIESLSSNVKSTATTVANKTPVNTAPVNRTSVSTAPLYKESYGGKDISSFNNRVDAFNKINNLTNMSKSSTSYNDKRLAKNAADTQKTFDELDNLTATLMKMNMNDLKKMGL